MRGLLPSRSSIQLIGVQFYIVQKNAFELPVVKSSRNTMFPSREIRIPGIYYSKINDIMKILGHSVKDMFLEMQFVGEIVRRNKGVVDRKN